MKKHGLNSIFHNHLDENQMAAVLGGGDLFGNCGCVCTCIVTPDTNGFKESGWNGYFVKVYVPPIETPK